ncbi:MAG: hypothetical protein J7K21_07625 [Desulfurococcales archaeon]|nr:hypothetical protein [Desulfurococcales archaeon]
MYRRYRKYRSELQIFKDILEALASSRNGTMFKTRIMYAANLNTDSLSFYLNKLMDSGLITKKENGSKQAYTITNKGYSVLYLIDLLRDIMAKNVMDVNKIKLISDITELNNEAVDGYDIHGPILKKGKTGIIHIFDLLIQGKYSYVINFVEKTNIDFKVTWFLLSLIDTGFLRGILVTKDSVPKIISYKFGSITIYVLGVQDLDPQEIYRGLKAITFEEDNLQ